MHLFKQSKFFITIFILLLSATYFFIPLNTVYASSACTCTKNNDCLFANINSSTDSSAGCTTACQSAFPGSSPDYSVDNAADVKVFQCRGKHDAYLAAVAANASKAATPNPGAQLPEPAITPTLNIPIPGLKFVDANLGDGTSVSSTYLADYLSAAYQFLIGISLTIAIVMVMIGGLQYVLASGSGKVEKGKTRIKNATVGLILLLSVYLILYTVNPRLTLLTTLKLDNIAAVEGIGNSDATDASDETANYPSVSITAGQIPQFKQCGSPWGNIPYKGLGGSAVSCPPNKHSKIDHEDNICESGCGPTATAVVLGYYGQNADPAKVAAVASKVGAHIKCSSGTSYPKLCDSVAANWPGMTCKSVPAKDTDTLAKYLTIKKPIVFSCHGCTGKRTDGSNKSYGGHYMVLTGVSGSSFSVFDPGNQNGIVSIPFSEFANGKVMTTYLIDKK